MATFGTFVGDYRKLLRAARNIPLGCDSPLQLPPIRDTVPKVAIFSPHPDDEVLAGSALAMRLRREGCPVTNVAMTLGSDRVERARRLVELERACTYLGFDVQLLALDGFESGNEKTHPGWDDMVERVEAFLECGAPSIVIVHHLLDAHPTHHMTAQLVRTAMRRAKWTGLLFEAEDWSEMSHPNLLVEVSERDLVYILEALSFHKGELVRNPYHIREPGRLSNNVRRSELVFGKGTQAPEIDFAVLYRRVECAKGKMWPVPGKSRFLSTQNPVTMIL